MCGTPVVAYRRGSMPEVVDEGLTGFLADTSTRRSRPVGRALELDREAVRAQAISRFSVDRMVDGYLEVYEKMLAARRPSNMTVPPPPGSRRRGTGHEVLHVVVHLELVRVRTHADRVDVRTLHLDPRPR